MIGIELQAGTYAADEFGDRQLADAAEQINVLSRQTTANIVRIGQLLVQAKAQCTHGQWGAWLENEVSYSQATANRFMAVADRFADRAQVQELAISKVYALLAAPEEAVDELAEAAKDLSVRQLQERIRALETENQELGDEMAAAIDEAKEEALREAQEEKERLEEQARDWSARVNELQMQINEKEIKLREAAQRASNAEQSAQEALRKAKQELKSLQAKEPPTKERQASLETETLREELRKAQEEKARAEAQREETERQLIAVKAGYAKPANPQHVRAINQADLQRAVAAFLRDAAALPYMGARLAIMPESLKDGYRDALQQLGTWYAAAQAALDGVALEIDEGGETA